MKLGFLNTKWLSLMQRNVMNNVPQRITTRYFSEGGAAATEPPLDDLHGRRHTYLRVSLTERCNLRCTYCMPAGGVALTPHERLLTLEEMARAVRVLAAAGVSKVRLTGGEPTLRPDLAAAVAAARAPGVRAVGLTSNGVALARRLPELRRAGLTHVNVSLDSLRPERFARVTRRAAAALPRVRAALDTALQLGFSPVKINVVLVKGFNDDEVGDFVELTRDHDFEVRFIEFMPFTGNRWDGAALVPARAALRLAGAAHDLAPEPPRPHDTARLWRAAGHRGTVGFISSMTEHFCASCNRLRLTADGSLKVCLFGAAEVSLRDEMRAGADDARLLSLARAALRNKRPRHAGECAAARAAPAPRRAAHAPPSSPACRHDGARALRRQPADGAHRRLAARGYCTGGGGGGGGLTHVDAGGRARMVDVGDKPETARAARAECAVRLGARALRLLRDPAARKGDALCVARVAGVLAAKRAADLIPLCHPLPLSSVRVSVELPRGAGRGGGVVRVTCSVRAAARTGAEMEALAGCAVAALALYDMVKAADRGIVISDLRLVHKEGGRSGPTTDPAPWDSAPEDSAPAPRDSAPAAESRDEKAEETFAPTNVTHL